MKLGVASRLTCLENITQGSQKITRCRSTWQIKNLILFVQCKNIGLNTRYRLKFGLSEFSFLRSPEKSVRLIINNCINFSRSEILPVGIKFQAARIFLLLEYSVLLHIYYVTCFQPSLIKFKTILRRSRHSPPTLLNFGGFLNTSKRMPLIW